ncbi:hypothetical protein G9A89_002756 [Geosiphon pyriformis]|nr:hypothetical protein G9A89_002756 [Geosiphon pyriformis]
MEIFSNHKKCQDLDYLAVDYKILPPLPSKFSSNFANGLKVFKSLFAESKSYVKVIVFVVLFVAAAVDMDLALSGSFKATISMLPVVSFTLNNALNELFLLIKSIVESVGSLVVLITKLLFTSLTIDITVKKSVSELAKQIKAVVSDNNVNCEVTPVTQRSTSEETIDSEYQMERNITSTAKKEDINTNPRKSLTVKTARPTTLLFRFETTNRLFGSVNTNSGNDMLLQVII